MKFIIESITWNRIYLKVEFNKNIDDDIFIVCGNNKKKICNEYVKSNKLIIPITCAYDDIMIEQGSWKFLYKDEFITICTDEAKTLDSKDKVFFYKDHDYAYIVTFSISDDFELIMNINFMKKNKKINSNTKISSNRPLLNNITKFISICIITIMKLLYSFMRLFHSKRGNKLLFMSQTRDSLEGNLLALNNRMIERGLNNEYKIYYSFKKVLSDKKSPIYYFKIIYLLSKVDYVFVDDYAPIFGLLNLKNTKLIQLWHAGVGFKSVGYSRFGKEGSPHPIISSHRKYTYAVVAAPSLIETYQEVFGLTKKHFLAPGMLRLDGYLDEKNIIKYTNEIREKYPEIKNRKVILFAPTYRGAGQAEAYYDFNKIDLEKLYKVCKEKNYITLFKFHPFIRKKISIPNEYSDYIKDISDYKNINNLFYITDILITDYSSNIYEYSLFEKPIIFFDYDMDNYSILRGVHQDLESSPGNICKTFDEVILVLENENFEIEKVKEFKNKNILLDGSNACDKLIKEIFNK